MDITKTIEPRSDQLNADDLLTGDITVTIEDVTKGSPEQPVNIHLAGYPGRPFKPSKSMRRMMVAAWGPDAKQYIGRSMTLYRDPSIKFGKEQVGGIRISHMSHIDKPLTVALTVTRGRRAPFTVKPLKDAPKTPDTAPGPALDLAPMWAALNDAGFTNPETARTTVERIIGRQITSSTDLTADDMTAVMKELAALATGDGDE